MDATGPTRGQRARQPQAKAQLQVDSDAPVGSDRDVTFCIVERVAGQVFVCIATTALQGWSIYRVTKYGATPVQVVVDGGKSGGLISNVRFFRLFQLPQSRKQKHSGTANVGALFVSERCAEVDYRRTSSRDGLEEQRHVEDEDYDAMVMTEDDEAMEDLTVFSLADERVLKKLAPSPSLVIDIQFNASTAAILCESNEILLYDLRTFEMIRRIGTSAVAMSLGPRWIAYPGFVPDRDRESMDGSSSSESEEVVPEALVGSKQYSGSKLESSQYTAIDVAQNVASGLYYLSEIGRATIAPYLSSSPSATSSIPSNSATPVGSIGYASSYSPYGSVTDTAMNGKSAVVAKSKRDSSSTSASAYSGWVVVQDIATERVICNFKCHSTALVTLSFDFSGLLLATCSTKGQNLHVYRLTPPLQATQGKKSDGYQLLYKLQRGITHASIQDIAFSQDAKWVNVTSAHGTSHLYAIHPEGVRINADSHVNVIGVAVHNDVMDVPSLRDVDDFYADFRTLESKTLTQVLKIRHSMPAAVAPSTSAVSHSSSSPPVARGSYLVESALDASQAFFSHLAQSTNISMDFGYYNTDENDVEARRKRRRRRISCLFAHDDTKMLICCDRVLKLYDMKVQPTSSASNGVGGGYVPSSALAMDNSKLKTSNNSSSTFGFDASVTELKSWELLNQPRTKTTPSTGDDAIDTATSQKLLIQTKSNGKSELRTFAQRTIPLWAHPKVTFRAIDEDAPEGRVLEIKRKGPNQDNSSNGALHGDEQMFVLEMDSYFGIGGSPVFDGQSECRVAPEVPPLDLRESINMAMSTSIPSPSHPMRAVPIKTSVCSNTPPPPAFPDMTTTTSKKKKKKNGRSLPIEDASESSGMSTLQFTLQDMYFALPKEKLS
uniref:BCAS3 WD40 domain-containing protein n=1 Tax=Globisporangium ultimum (strain ATCC 200006 / CBS 805.95 / DAOM BR144) TaxID=431595 RepID=K3X320_GLOUD